MIELKRITIQQSQQIIELLNSIKTESGLEHFDSDLTKHSVGISPHFIAKQSYTESELMTVDEACRELLISRWKLTDMRNKGQLTTIERGRSVRLIRAEVEAAKLWYSIPKGKI